MSPSEKQAASEAGVCFSRRINEQIILRSRMESSVRADL